jgi:hypothetical protein
MVSSRLTAYDSTGEIETFGRRGLILKYQSRLLGLVLASSMASSALAADTMLRACTGEIQKYKCDAKSESYAYECLSKHEEQRTKNHGFSRPCFKAYASYEKSTGKGDKIESHQVENPEHSK